MVSPPEPSVRRLAAAIREGNRSSVNLIEASLERIEANSELNAFITVLEDGASERAREIDAAAERDEDPGALCGVPVAIKDLRNRKRGVRHTLGLEPLVGNVAESDSIGVERLEASGAVIVGTTNTPALGHTIQTENRIAGATSTPFDLERSAGGSSGGSAAAVAAGIVGLATGSDIGGSIRVPASCCNVVGLKPTLGVVPEREPADGFSPHTPFLVSGPIARTVKDTALLLDVLAGPDERDPHSVPDVGADYLAATDRPAGKLSIAYSPDLNLQPVAPAVRETVGEAVDELAAAGATVEPVDVSLPDYDELSMAYVVQVGTFFRTFANRIADQHGVDFETADLEGTVRATLRLADGVETVDERERNVSRTAAYDGIRAAISGHDALITPTLTVPPYGKHLDDPFPTEIDDTAVRGVPTDAMLTWVFNLTGHPAASVPAGFTDDGLPVGLQVVGHRHAEADVLAVGAALERARPWADRYPER